MTKMTWGSSHKYDNGLTPSVALDSDGVAVEVHESQNESTLWYHVGTVDITSKKVAWGKSHKYDQGTTPAVAITAGGLAIEVHQSDKDDALWYHVGQVDAANGTVTWGKSHKYDPGGFYPRIAVNASGLVVEVHTSRITGADGRITSYCWYSVGQLDAESGTIAWGDSHKYEDSGADWYPSVALTEDGTVVEVHLNTTGVGASDLVCRVGRVNPSTRTIAFTTGVRYDTGTRPSVSINRSGTLLEVHHSQNDDGLWYHVGQLDTSTQEVAWSNSHKYDVGGPPCASIDDAGRAVEVHQSQNDTVLWYHVGQLT